MFFCKFVSWGAMYTLTRLKVIIIMVADNLLHDKMTIIFFTILPFPTGFEIRVSASHLLMRRNPCSYVIVQNKSSSVRL